MQLAKVELSEKASTVGRQATVIAAGALLAYAGLLMIGAGIVLTLIALGLSPWLSAFVGGAISVGVGYVLIRIGHLGLATQHNDPKSDNPDRPGDCAMGERSQLSVGSSVTVDELQAEIAHTRENVSETLDAIQHRLSPRTIAARVSHVARDTAERTVASPFLAFFIGAAFGCAMGFWRRRAASHTANALLRR